MLLLADRGYQEAITYSFVDPRLQRLLFPEPRALVLANPISAELARCASRCGRDSSRRCARICGASRIVCALFEVGTRFEMQDGRLAESQAHRGTDHWPRVRRSNGEPTSAARISTT